MATHSSVLAWRSSHGGAWWATVHGVAKCSVITLSGIVNWTWICFAPCHKWLTQGSARSRGMVKVMQRVAEFQDEWCLTVRRSCLLALQI